MIEETLLKHREVMLAAAVSKPDAYAGELPIAYVQLVRGRQGQCRRDCATSRQHIPERAAAPKEIVIVDKMPLTDVRKARQGGSCATTPPAAPFTTLLADVTEAPAKLVVDMVADPLKGNARAHPASRRGRRQRAVI